MEYARLKRTRKKASNMTQKRKRRVFTEQFKKQMVDLVLSGKPQVNSSNRISTTILLLF